MQSRSRSDLEDPAVGAPLTELRRLALGWDGLRAVVAGEDAAHPLDRPARRSGTSRACPRRGCRRHDRASSRTGSPSSRTTRRSQPEAKRADAPPWAAGRSGRWSASAPRAPPRGHGRRLIPVAMIPRSALPSYSRDRPFGLVPGGDLGELTAQAVVGRLGVGRDHDPAGMSRSECGLGPCGVRRSRVGRWSWSGTLGW